MLADQHVPSFLQNSCTGTVASERGENEDSSQNSSEHPIRPKAGDKAEHAQSEKEGWTKSLNLFPNFHAEKINDRLIRNSVTIPKNGAARKAFRNKKQGYKLWKEGYARGVLVKPNVQGERLLFLVKARVHASMKSTHYNVYVHLDQESADAVYAKCNCKAGQGGCCKHVGALLYTLLDYINMGVTQIPRDLTCTQVGQKWHVPTDAGNQLSRAFKFQELVFEKAEEGKKRKRPLVTGSRESHCATPPYALETNANELQNLVEKLRLAGKATLFCEAVESNEFVPCSLYETSCSKVIEKILADSTENESPEEEFGYIGSIYKNSHHETPNMEPLIAKESIQAVIDKVGVSVEESVEICKKTIMQSTEPIWYLERSKRITASIFGKVLNRRMSTNPAALISTITDKFSKSGSMPAALRWGIDCENIAIERYEEMTYCHPIKKCGFFINPKWPWLGCSPDGIVFESKIPVGCLEVKCPYSKRDMTMREACMSDRNFFLRLVDDCVQLKRKHSYYYQCQGVLNLLGLNWIDFVVYTTKDVHVERIQKDELLWTSKMLPTLTTFFVNYILPKL